MTELEDPQTLPKKKPKKILLVWVAAFLVIAVVSGTFFYWANIRDKLPKPSKSIISSVSKGVPLYYPKELPGELYVKQDTIKSKNDITIYQIADGGKDVVSVSIQPIPQEFDFAGFYKQTLQGEQFEVKNGEAYIGSFNNRTVASLKTADTWILVTGTGNLGVNEIKQITSKLENISN